MPNQNTSASGGIQAHCDLHEQCTGPMEARAQIRPDRECFSIPQEPPRRRLTQGERAKVSRWLRGIDEGVRAHDLVRGDECLAKTIVKYPSIAVCGWTWPSEKLLAEALNECDRNIRKREKRLRDAGVLVVVAPGEGWRSNRYVPMLGGQPLFDVALRSEQVRAAIAAQLGDDRDDRRTGSPSPPHNLGETGTPVPLEEEHVFRSGRNEHSAESSAVNTQERKTPTPYPAPEPPVATSEEEGETIDANLQETEAPASSDPAPSRGDATRADQPTWPNGRPTDNPENQAVAEKVTSSVLEFTFARLMHLYPHPSGPHGIDHEAYRGHARKAWNSLTIEQQQAAIRAVANAPGKEWLGHWLNTGRETGNFKIVDQEPELQRVWVPQDTPQFRAWIKYCAATGRRPQTMQRRIAGLLQSGWWFESEWPPGFEGSNRVGGVQ